MLGAALSYFRRFYLDQNIFEFDPVEMLYACVYLASKTEELNFTGDIRRNIDEYVKKIGQEKYCNIDSKSIIILIISI